MKLSALLLTFLGATAGVLAVQASQQSAVFQISAPDLPYADWDVEFRMQSGSPSPLLLGQGSPNRTAAEELVQSMKACTKSGCAFIHPACHPRPLQPCLRAGFLSETKTNRVLATVNPSCGLSGSAVAEIFWAAAASAKVEEPNGGAAQDSEAVTSPDSSVHLQPTTRCDYRAEVNQCGTCAKEEDCGGSTGVTKLCHAPDSQCINKPPTMGWCTAKSPKNSCRRCASEHDCGNDGQFPLGPSKWTCWQDKDPHCTAAPDSVSLQAQPTFTISAPDLPYGDWDVEFRMQEASPSALLLGQGAPNRTAAEELVQTMKACATPSITPVYPACSFVHHACQPRPLHPCLNTDFLVVTEESTGTGRVLATVNPSCGLSVSAVAGIFWAGAASAKVEEPKEEGSSGAPGALRAASSSSCQQSCAENFCEKAYRQAPASATAKFLATASSVEVESCKAGCAMPNAVKAAQDDVDEYCHTLTSPASVVFAACEAGVDEVRACEKKNQADLPALRASLTNTTVAGCTWAGLICKDIGHACDEPLLNKAAYEMARAHCKRQSPQNPHQRKQDREELIV